MAYITRYNVSSIAFSFDYGRTAIWHERYVLKRLSLRLSNKDSYLFI